jgi:hypothetical protein
VPVACASALCLAYLAGLKRQNVPIARDFGLLAAGYSPRKKMRKSAAIRHLPTAENRR